MTKKTTFDLESAIQLSWAEKAPCTFDVTVTLDSASINEIFDLVLGYAMKQVTLPGFRPGTAPKNLVESKHKESIGHDVTERIVSTAFAKIQKDKTKSVLGYKLPEDAALNFKRDESVNFVFEISVAPEVKLPEYKSVKVDVDLTKIDADSVAKRVEQLREAFGEFKDVATGITKDALAQVSYEADVILEDDAPAKLKALLNADKTWLWFNSDERIPGINAAIMGKKLGESVNFKATFPADHEQPFLAGKTIDYKVTVLGVQERVAQTDDKVLFQKLNVENMEQLQARLEKDLQQEADMNNETAIGDAIKTKIFENTPTFSMPASIVEAEANRCMREIAREVIKSESDVAAFHANRESHETEAKKRAEKNTRELFIIRAIADNEKLTVSQEEFNAQIEGMAQYFGTNVAEMRKRIEENHAETEVANSLLTQKVTSFLAKESQSK